MQIGILNEPSDRRVALVPEIVKQLNDRQVKVLVEADAGLQSAISNEDFQQGGAEVTDRQRVLQNADILITLEPPDDEVYSQMKSDAVIISSFEPFNKPQTATDLARHPVTALSLDMIPRITLAQSMDVLSSMASIAGYKAVLLAALEHSRRFLKTC